MNSNKSEEYEVFGMLFNAFNEKRIKFFIAGGYSLFIEDKSKKYNDCDFWFYTEEDYIRAKDTISNILDKNISMRAHETDNAWSSSYYLKFQLIKKHFGTPQEIMKHFDMYHVRLAYNYDKEKIDMREGIINEIVPSKNFNNSSMKRLFKYIERGYKISSNNFNMYVEAYTNGELTPLYGEEASKDDLFKRCLQNNSELPDVIPSTFKTGWIDLLFSGEWTRNAYETLRKTETDLNEEQQMVKMLLEQWFNKTYISKEYLSVFELKYPEQFLTGKSFFWDVDFDFKFWKELL